MTPTALLKQRRLALGITQASLAARTGTAQPAISRIERGLEEPSFGRFTLLLRALGSEPRLELGPLPEPDPDARQLAEQLRKSPATRLEELIRMQALARELRGG